MRMDASDMMPGALGLVLALACVAIGLLRGGVETLARGNGPWIVGGVAQWLASPPGLLITAALALALYQYRRPHRPPHQNEIATPDEHPQAPGNLPPPA